ncbi:MAG: AAA family ATPase, partial [Terriglobales bacterium]
QAQAADVVLVALPEPGGEGPEVALALIAFLCSQKPQLHVVVVGPLDSPQWIVGAMRAGASEYLERPLKPGALEEAIERWGLTRNSEALAPASRGKLIAVVGSRGGCGATTVAVNLALSLQALRRENDPSVVLLDAAPLGHAALHLNLKQQFTLADLLGHSARLDAAMLASLLVRHESGLELLAGPGAPLPASEARDHTGWLELMRMHYPVVVMDLSTRLDGLTTAAIEHADRILFVTQTDMVSLWSAAKVRQHLDSQARLKFELVLNRYTATPEVDLSGVESITHADVLWRLPNAHALVVKAIERGEPPAAKVKSELARSYRALAAELLGRPTARRRSWIPFLRLRAAQS